jgi:hypothetical protein
MSETISSKAIEVYMDRISDEYLNKQRESKKREAEDKKTLIAKFKALEDQRRSLAENTALPKPHLDAQLAKVEQTEKEVEEKALADARKRCAELRDCAERVNLRCMPIGTDRNFNRYWLFDGEYRLWIEKEGGRTWEYLDTQEGIEALIASLDERGSREYQLKATLKDMLEDIKVKILSKGVTPISSVVEIEPFSSYRYAIISMLVKLKNRITGELITPGWYVRSIASSDGVQFRSSVSLWESKIKELISKTTVENRELLLTLQELLISLEEALWTHVDSKRYGCMALISMQYI